MRNEYLDQPFELHVSDIEHWKQRPLKFQFFEIVLILDGEGTRIVNDNKFSYHKGSIFLFTPLDCRGFESCTQTRFCSIRFSEVFLEKYKNGQEKEKVIARLKRLESVFIHHNRFEQVLIKDDSDCNMITLLIDNMIEEYKNKQSYYDENLQYFVNLILNIIFRNVGHHEIPISNVKAEEPLINKMLVYLHRHINSPEKLRIKNLSAQFNLSSNYIGEYFKKLTGDRLQCYLSQYKMNIVEERLTYSQYTISQIAYELGFTDESHLSRQFKKERGISPAEFRRQRKS